MKDLQIRVNGSPKFSWSGNKIDPSNSTDIEVTASDFNSDNYNYVSLISTGNSCDLGYECDMSNNQIYVPSVLSQNTPYYYPYFYARHFYVWVEYNGKVIAERDLTDGGTVGYYGGAVDSPGNIPGDWRWNLYGLTGNDISFTYSIPYKKYTSSSSWHYEYETRGSSWYLSPNLDISGGPDIDGYYARIGDYYFCIAGERAFLNIDESELNVIENTNLYAKQNYWEPGKGDIRQNMNNWEVFFKPCDDNEHKINTVRLFLREHKISVNDTPYTAGPIAYLKSGFRYSPVYINKNNSDTIVYDGSGAGMRYGAGRTINGEVRGPGSIVRKNYLDKTWICDNDVGNVGNYYSENIVNPTIKYNDTDYNFNITVTFVDINGNKTTIYIPSSLSLYACPKNHYIYDTNNNYLYENNTHIKSYMKRQ